MGDPLAGIDAKLKRGLHHLEKIESQVRPFVKGESWEVAFQPDGEPGWTLALFVVKREAPIEWSVIAGEAFAQFASSLDHLMTELAILRHPGLRKRPDRSPNFPICAPGIFWRNGLDGKRSTADSIRDDVRPEHFTEIERLQPRKDEDLSVPTDELSVMKALAIIRWVNNLYKHATVRPAFFSPQWVGSHTEPNVTAFEWLYEPGTRLSQNTPLYRAKFVGEPEVGVPMTVEPDLSFGTRPYEWVNVEMIRACGIWTQWIIARFRELTPEFRT